MTHSGPTKVGKYEVITLLAEGGMARVYLALARGPAAFNKLVVIKQIRPEYAWDREFLAMFFDEARIAARLNHPNVVHTYEVLEEGGQYYLVMEYLDGQPLSQLLRRVGRANMPLEEHLWILIQVLSGLDHAHELRDFDGSPLGIVHRDVSPSNVFVTYNGEVKLVDFGIAKAVGAFSATQQGTMKGKIGYAAPEQCLGAAVDARTDVFAVGVMLWEALAGRRLKLGGNIADMFQARTRGTEPKIREVNPEAPAQLADICDRATAVDPKRRYSSALEMLHELERYLATVPRRVGTRNVSALLATHFAKERAERRKHIEERLSTATLDQEEPVPPNTAVTEVRTPSAPNSWGGSQPNFRTSIVPRRPVVVLGAGLLAVTAGAIVFANRGQEDSAEAHAPVASAAAFASPGKSKPAQEPAEHQGETIELAVRAKPENAILVLDGKRLASNPFTAEMPKERRTHVLRATAPGYRAAERVITFQKDLDIELALSKLGRTRVSRAQPKPENPAETQAKAAPPPEPSKPSRAALQPAPKPKPQAIEPGMDLSRPAAPRPQRQIDDEDPYAQ